MRSIEQYKKKVRRPFEVKLTPNISPHILRHTYATRMAEKGCDIKVLQYMLGQTDIRTAMRVYNHVEVGRVKRELDKLDNVQERRIDSESFYTKFYTN